MTSNRSNFARRHGFTLIEVLVVMGIIILLIALALPAFRFITGSRSAEAASNQIAAVLSIARVQAIGVQETRGVAIYRDGDNDRNIAVLVELRSTPIAAFVAGTSVAGGGINYVRGQYVQDANKVYVCIEPYQDTGLSATDPSGGSGYWRYVPSMDNVRNGVPLTLAPVPFIEVTNNAEFMPLPKGIDVRGVCNQFRFPNNATGSTDPRYRYTNPTVVLFDSNGQIVSQPYLIAREGILGQTLTQQAGQAGAFVPLPRVAANAYGLLTNPANTIGTTSQIGLVAFDSDALRNNAPNISDSATAPNDADVQKVNDWLDQNATPLMINRYNGTLVKGD